MQHFLDFLYEHGSDEALYCVVPAADGELQLAWRAKDPLHWEVQSASPGPADRVPRSDLVPYLTRRRADLVPLARELESLVAAHVVVAHQRIEAAHSAFGADAVGEMLRGHQQLISTLRQELTRLLPSRLRLVR